MHLGPLPPPPSLFIQAVDALEPVRRVWNDFWRGTHDTAVKGLAGESVVDIATSKFSSTKNYIGATVQAPFNRAKEVQADVNNVIDALKSK